MKKLILAAALAAVSMSLFAPPAPAALRPSQNALPDANHDGKPDVDTILGCIEYLVQQGVVYDDHDPQGHVPVRRLDGKFHMVCVDLLTVCYRNAGYEFGGAADTFGASQNRHNRAVPSSHFRRCVNLQQRVMSDPRFHYFPGPNENPLTRQWRPAQPFRVGDMVFAAYTDANEHHAGIVTSVDSRNGLPATVAQISSYTPTGGIHRSTWREFFWLKCRALTGWARPAEWDTAPMGATERALTGVPPHSVDANPHWLGAGSALITSSALQAALEKVRASRRGVYSPEPVAEAESPLTLGPRNRHATHFFQ